MPLYYGKKLFEVLCKKSGKKRESSSTWLTLVLSKTQKIKTKRQFLASIGNIFKKGRTLNQKAKLVLKLAFAQNSKNYFLECV